MSIVFYKQNDVRTRNKMLPSKAVDTCTCNGCEKVKDILLSTHYYCFNMASLEIDHNENRHFR